MKRGITTRSFCAGFYYGSALYYGKNMATYVIGDIQGCFATFCNLLKHLRFDSASDHAFIVGDLLNRGPQSLEALRYVRTHEKNFSLLLGNHEIFAIALKLNATQAKKSHTLHSLLDAPDSLELIDWLRQRPVLIQYNDNIFIHAGIHPNFNIEDALAYNNLIQEKLSSNDADKFLYNYYQTRLFDPQGCESSEEKVRFALAAFTLLRTCNNSGLINIDFTGILNDVPYGFNPWFTTRNDHNFKIFFGHWAALGPYRYKNYYCLDSGCGWGKPLSALRLEDYQLFQVDNYDID
jgi:bis(5'-nucleosyl)-tetraphosphatase (symmetrical)